MLAEQDRPIVESQLPAELPLDLADELQLPFDRVAIAYRRGMALPSWGRIRHRSVRSVQFESDETVAGLPAV